MYFGLPKLFPWWSSSAAVGAEVAVAVARFYLVSFSESPSRCHSSNTITDSTFTEQNISEDHSSWSTHTQSRTHVRTLVTKPRRRRSQSNLGYWAADTRLKSEDVVAGGGGRVFPLACTRERDRSRRVCENPPLCQKRCRGALAFGCCWSSYLARSHFGGDRP